LGKTLKEFTVELPLLTLLELLDAVINPISEGRDQALLKLGKACVKALEVSAVSLCVSGEFHECFGELIEAGRADRLCFILCFIPIRRPPQI